MEGLTFQYPAWFMLFCVFLGLGYALALYFRDRTFGEQSPTLNWGLGGLRFLVVTLLSMLLLSPLLKSLLTETKKPVIILAQDASESVAAEMSEEERAVYQQSIQNLADELGKQYEVVQYSFGSDVREGIDFAFADKATDIAAMLRTTYDLYSNQNLGAIILASDGIYNQGSNPVYTGAKLAAPIYSIALGDTIPKKDVVVKRVFHNKITYLGDRFSVQIDVAAQNCAGSSTTMTVSKIENGGVRQLQQLPITIDKNDFFTTREVILEAQQPGVQRYRISLSAVPQEATTGNNTKDIFIDVLDARQKILLLANAPHPDLTAIKQSIGTNKNYEVTTAYINDLKVNVADFDFVLLHQLPSMANPATAVLNTLKTRTLPHFFIVGTQTNLNAFNQAQSLVKIQGDNRNTNEVQARVAPNFNLFTLDEQVLQQTRQYPPLLTPFSTNYQVSPNAQVLLYQRIGRVDTEYPLLVLGEEQGTKVGVMMAEGIWKWRLFNFLQNENHEAFDELYGKTIQYVSLKEDKRRFRINLDKNIFNENEQIIFGAELYNESYELVNEPDASLTIRNTEGRDFNYVFNKSGSAYTLNAGILPVGDYTFRGSVTLNGENLTYDGQFSVQPLQLELYETTADHSLLRLLSQEFGGEVVYPQQIASLPDLLNAKGNVKPVIYQTSKTRSVINLKWIFFLLLGLLTLEWFLRRYFGAY